MNLPGHTGLTLGAFLAVGYLGDIWEAYSLQSLSSNRRWLKSLGAVLNVPPSLFHRLHLDYRVVLAGSLLPDFIDKPLGLLLLPQLLELNGRTIGHTLVFNLVLLLIGLVVMRLAHSPTPLVLAVSSTGHLALDQMWQTPQTLLWPLWGWRFPPGVPDLNEWLTFQLTAQWLSVPEVIGLLVLTWFVIQMWRIRAIHRFFKTGCVH